MASQIKNNTSVLGNLIAAIRALPTDGNIQIDTTLSVEGAAAEAKAVGEALAELASFGYVDNKVASLVNSAPQTLDTLNEIARALGNDPNFSTTILQLLGEKVDRDELVQSDWNETNENSLAFIKNKPESMGLELSDDEAFELAIEMGLIDPVVDENGHLFVDEEGRIFSL